MKHFKERADETHVYSIPRNFAAELVTLQDVLTHAGMHSKDDDIRDDGNELLALCGDDSPLVIFRIVNMAPKKRTVFMTASNDLRTDMVAVVLYEISSKSRSSKVLTIQDCFSTEMFQVHVLSLQTFLDMGVQKLKSAVIASEMRGNVVYHFSNINLPAVCRKPMAWELVSKLVGAGAYPGPNGCGFLLRMRLSSKRPCSSLSATLAL